MNVNQLIFEKLSTPDYDKELSDHIKDFKYGIQTKDNKIIHHDHPDFNKLGFIHKHMKLMTPDEVEKNKSGTCWDQSLYQYHKLKSAGYKTHMIHIHDKNYNNSHSAVIYKHKDGWKWHENSWHKHQGINGPYKNKRESINDIVKKFANDHSSKDPIYINKNPKVDEILGKHLNADEYINHMTKNSHKYKS